MAPTPTEKDIWNVDVDGGVKKQKLSWLWAHGVITLKGDAYCLLQTICAQLW